MWSNGTTNSRPLVNSFLLVTLLLFGPVGSLLAQTGPIGPGQAQVIAPFPRTYPISNGGQITLFEPQVESWAAQTHMIAWSAVSYTARSGDKPVIGSIKIEADTEIALDDRLVRFTNFTIPDVNFSSLSRDDARMVSSALQTALPDTDRVLALDKVFAAVDRSQLTAARRITPGIKSDPPTIFYSAAPAIMVAFDGDPVWSPIKDVDLKFAVNTNWDIFQQPSTKTFYLRSDANWFSSSDVKNGWVPAGTLPDSFSKLPADDNWKEVLANIPGKAVSPEKMPKIYVSTTPAEMIVTEGQPKYTPVRGTTLQWVNNTESDVFRNGRSGDFFYLVAGRWFSAPALTGPWRFATPNLPADFQKIPVEHPRSRVLGSVPGTQQANEGVLQATVRTTARVSKDLKAPEVVYQGDPQFENIGKTMISRAVNTDKEIILFRGDYYMCFEGVWFTSRSPSEYWTVATEVPKEIYGIPASSPVYNVTSVTVADDDPNDDWVTESYDSGYTGTEVAWGVPVWGTGWYYPPYVYYGGLFPIYYPNHRTFGMAAWYNPYLGVFGGGIGAYGPYGGGRLGAVYNPRTGAYARGASAYGPYRAEAFAQAYNPRVGSYAQTRQGGSVYGNWGSSYVQRGDRWAQTAHVSNNITGNTNAGIRTGKGTAAVTHTGNRGQTTVVRTPEGEIFAGHDGNVYRRHGDGYQRYDPSGNWVSSRGDQIVRDPGNRVPNPPGGVGGVGGIGAMGGVGSGQIRDQLDRDARARSEGAARAEALNNYRSNMGGRAAAGSFRGGGGGRRR